MLLVDVVLSKGCANGGRLVFSAQHSQIVFFLIVQYLCQLKTFEDPVKDMWEVSCMSQLPAKRIAVLTPSLFPGSFVLTRC